MKFSKPYWFLLTILIIVLAFSKMSMSALRKEGFMEELTNPYSRFTPYPIATTPRLTNPYSKLTTPYPRATTPRLTNPYSKLTTPYPRATTPRLTNPYSKLITPMQTKGITPVLPYN